MANEQNLRPVRTKKEARERGARGGKKSAESKRRKKSMQELAKAILELPIKASELDNFEEIKGFADIQGKNLTIAEASLLHQAQKAFQQGDLRALEFLRDTAGEKPVEKVEVNQDISQAETEIAVLISKLKSDGK